MSEPVERDADSIEQRLVNILNDYERELQEGNDPDPQALLDRHPELAPELSECLHGLAAMEELRDALLVDQPAAQTTPPSLGEYQILGEIGRGGMGVVFEAMHRRLHRRVALKMIKAGSLADLRDLEMFRKEAMAAASLQHPNIVQLFEFGEQEGHPYLVLEFVSGGTLETKLAGTPIVPVEAAQLLATLARAIHYAHARGIIHRDLKPGNILLASHTVPAEKASFAVPKITDFGLAKSLHSEEPQTHTRTIKGTPSYMAPEQAIGEVRGAATDVYALGAILYETMTGRPPFRAATPWETLAQVTSMEPVAPTRLQPNVPRDLETICLKCLCKESALRYDSAESLALDLERFLRHEPIQARPVGIAGRLWRWGRRNPAVAALLSASIALSCLVAALLFVRLLDERAARERILSESVFAANHLANTIVVELWKAAEAVDLAASDPELRKRLQQDRVRLAPVPKDNESAGPRFALPDAHRMLQPYLEKIQQRDGFAFHSWHVVDNEGILLADAPPPVKSVFGVSFQGRDYFVGAMRHAGTVGRARVHVSRAYQSSNDELYKITLSAVVYGDDGRTPLGVVCATLPTGFLDLTDAEHTTVLVGRIDLNDPHKKLPAAGEQSHYMILVHPAYGELDAYRKGRNAVRMPAATLPLAPRRLESRDELAAVARTAADAAKARHDAYEDPLGKVDPAKYGGRWLAGFAQVGNTDMVVVVQRRFEGQSETWFWSLLGAGGVLAAALGIIALRRLQAGRHVKASSPADQAPTVDFV